jgi:hypothetical protein
VKKVDLAYCAGLIDGEGCIRIKKMKAYRCQGRTTPGYHATIAVRMVELSGIETLCQTIGGWHYSAKASLKRGRPLHCWQMSDAKAEAALRALLPFLRVKQRQAEIVITLRDLQQNGKKHRTKVTGHRNFPNKYGTPRQVPNLAFTDEYVAECERLFQACKRLNRVGLAALEE